ncbi:hypothetical protein LJC07_04590 [Christensenellaceae bacterium OttesenSCG-928-L17]|nr:hypothetical protein [Christensenellaceae bacterium OttesenSCG-928-L17]
MNKRDEERIEKKVAAFDRWAISILVNVLVSLVTTLFILYTGGFIGAAY